MDNACMLDETRIAEGPAAETLGRLAGVRGVGITRIGKGYGLKVNLSGLPRGSDSLSEEITDVPVRIEGVGKICK